MKIIEINLYRDGSSFYIDLFGEKLLLPASKIKDIAEYQRENKKILFGIRSEEFSYQADSNLKVVFDNVEYMGSDSYGYIVSSYKDAIVMRFRASDPVVAKKPMPIGINFENSYLFDINSEDCISYPSKKIDIKNMPISDMVYGADTEKSKSLENLIYSSL